MSVWLGLALLALWGLMCVVELCAARGIARGRIVGRGQIRQPAAPVRAPLTQAQLMQVRLRHVLLIDPMLRACDQLRLWERLSAPAAQLHRMLTILEGRGHHPQHTQCFVAESLAMGYAALAVGLLLSGLLQEPAMTAVSLVLALLLPYARFRDVAQRMKRRREEVLLALPELLSKLQLLTGAGDTVLQALMRCALAKSGQMTQEKPDPLALEVQKLCNEVRNGESFAQALERFSKCCAMQETALFTTTLLLNYRRGGAHLTEALAGLSHTLWEKRKQIARTRGEEASSKLVFPMVLIFLGLMVVVAAPALLLMA